jgi:hypothetical protein
VHHIAPPFNLRFTVACRPGAEAGLSSSQLSYDVLDLAEGQPFALHVIRKADGSAIFDTTGHR